MPSSVHKVLVFTALGCGGVVIIVMVATMIFLLKQDPDFLSRSTSEVMYRPERSRAALDTFETLDIPAPDRRGDDLLLRPRGLGNGAAIALRVWRDTTYADRFVAYGDTLSRVSPAWANWIAAAAWSAVDSLVVAAGRPWALTGDALPGPDSSSGLTDALLNAQTVLSTARAMLARARSVAVDAPSTADTLVFAVFTIGRRLEQDAQLPHALLGCRLQRDALEMLARLHFQLADRSLQRDVELRTAQLRHALLLIRAAGALPDQATALAARVRSPALPLPLRAELLLAIGYGWALDPTEAQRISPMRAAALGSLESAGLPPPLRPFLRAAYAAATAGFGRRLLVPNEYQNWFFAMQYGAFGPPGSRPRDILTPTTVDAAPSHKVSK